MHCTSKRAMWTVASLKEDEVGTIFKRIRTLLDLTTGGNDVLKQY
jgi:hypothetical protein